MTTKTKARPAKAERETAAAIWASSVWYLDAMAMARFLAPRLLCSQGNDMIVLDYQEDEQTARFAALENEGDEVVCFSVGPVSAEKAEEIRVALAPYGGWLQYENFCRIVAEAGVRARPLQWAPLSAD